jgi:hypothetical protein
MFLLSRLLVAAHRQNGQTWRASIHDAMSGVGVAIAGRRECSMLARATELTPPKRKLNRFLYLQFLTQKLNKNTVKMAE